jgi:DNA transformation protein
MGASAEFIEYIRELLQPLGELSQGRFFGGFAFKQNGKQFAMIMGNTLYFCVNDYSRSKYEELGMEPFAYHSKKQRVVVKRYYTVPEEVCEDSNKLVDWAQEAILAANIS